ncbi:MAG: hypothetical protein Q9227_000981 [Pyrenula ochraceoflavens]
MSYYDIDAILTDAQKLPCTFQLDVPGLGYLDNNAGEGIKAGTRVDLPLWLGEMLAVSTRLQSDTPLLKIEYPTTLSPRVLNALRADPLTVDLRALSPHFYSLAMRCFDLFDDDEVVGVMLETFKIRSTHITDHAHNARTSSSSSSTSHTATSSRSSTSHRHTATNENTSSNIGSEGVEFLRGLDELERGLFRRAHDGAKGVKGWEVEEAGRK